jgi:hypothetical protein
LVRKHLFSYGEDTDKKTFWFLSIDNAFSDPFWGEWISSMDDLRFCAGLAGKNNAFVCCSSHEKQAIFTTGGRNTYHANPLSRIEERILKLAKFVMSFQKAYVQRLLGFDYKVTWDANLLHHVVGPITEAVYGAHSDFSPLLCSLMKDRYKHVENTSYLPTREEMQVLTIYCSNYRISDGSCTSISYTYHDKLIGSASLGSRGIHIQGPGSQSTGIKHRISVKKGAN